MLASRSQLNASQLRQWNKAKFTREKSHSSSHHHHHILPRETDVSSNADANTMLERGSVTTIVNHLNSTLSLSEMRCERREHSLTNQLIGFQSTCTCMYVHMYVCLICYDFIKNTASYYWNKTTYRYTILV